MAKPLTERERVERCLKRALTLWSGKLAEYVRRSDDVLRCEREIEAAYAKCQAAIRTLKELAKR